MGNSSSKRCAPVSTFDARRNLHVYELGPTVSISNPSLKTLSTVESNILETTPSKQFTEEYMEAVYAQYKKDNGLDRSLSYNIVRMVSSVFETLSLDDHILFIANYFFERMYNDDPNYLSFFSDCVMKNDITQFENRNYSAQHRMVLHIMFYFKMQKFILETLGDGKEDKAHEILNLIALSHLIMQVDEIVFEQYSRKVIQIIIHFNLIHEEQLPAFVYYLVTIVGYICTMMKKYRQRHVKLYETTTDQNTPARDNYRELKKWKALVATLGKSLSKPMSLFDRQTDEEKRRTHARISDLDEEKWNIIRVLKKGFKFKDKFPRGSVLKVAHSNLELLY